MKVKVGQIWMCCNAEVPYEIVSVIEDYCSLKYLSHKETIIDCIPVELITRADRLLSPLEVELL